MKLVLTYDPKNGASYPDGECAAKALAMCNLRGSYVFSSQLLFDHIRLLVKRGVMPVEELEVWFGQLKICVDKNGRVAHWPKGFCDYFLLYWGLDWTPIFRHRML